MVYRTLFFHTFEKCPLLCSVSETHTTACQQQHFTQLSQESSSLYNRCLAALFVGCDTGRACLCTFILTDFLVVLHALFYCYSI